MEQRFKFRPLRAEEIDVRIGSINKGGVSLLLYKDARCDQAILDESVGPFNWQRHHLRDNSNCIISIWDDEKRQWIEKEDTGIESVAQKEKGLASDSFKRAAFNWGIGRELYTAKDLNIFIFKNDLKGYSYNEQTRKGACSERFIVTDIDTREKENGEKYIHSVTIGIIEPNNSCSGTKKFTVSSTQVNSTPVSTNAAPTAKPVSLAPAKPAAPSNGSLTAKLDSVLNDDEVILMGNCRNKRYGDVKNTPEFASFLNWAKSSTVSYTGQVNEQFKKIKAAL